MKAENAARKVIVNDYREDALRCMLGGESLLTEVLYTIAGMARNDRIGIFPQTPSVPEAFWQVIDINVSIRAWRWLGKLALEIHILRSSLPLHLPSYIFRGGNPGY